MFCKSILKLKLISDKNPYDTIAVTYSPDWDEIENDGIRRKYIFSYAFVIADIY